MTDNTSVPLTRMQTMTNDDEISTMPPSTTGTAPVTRTTTAPSLLASASISGAADDQASTNQTQPGKISLRGSWAKAKESLFGRTAKPPVEPVRAMTSAEGPLNFGGFRCYALNDKKFLAALSCALNQETGGFSRLITEGPDGGKWKIMNWPQDDLTAKKRSNKHCFLVLQADESFNKDTTEGQALVWSPKEGAEDLRQPHGSGKVQDLTRCACRITDGGNTRDLVLRTQLLHTDPANGLAIDQRVMYFDCSVHAVRDV